MKKIICFFKGHVKPTAKQIKDINYALMMYGCDCWGSDAFSNIEKMWKVSIHILCKL